MIELDAMFEAKKIAKETGRGYYFETKLYGWQVSDKVPLFRYGKVYIWTDGASEAHYA